MKLKYKISNSPAPFSKQKLLRPIIPISLNYGYLSLRYEALIDSGADFCIFPTGIAQRLKINLSKLKKIYFAGATGDMIEGKISTVYLDIGLGKFKTQVVFADLSGNVAILGQYGFFTKFSIRFELEKSVIDLKANSK